MQLRFFKVKNCYNHAFKIHSSLIGKVGSFLGGCREVEYLSGESWIPSKVLNINVLQVIVVLDKIALNFVNAPRKMYSFGVWNAHHIPNIMRVCDWKDGKVRENNCEVCTAISEFGISQWAKNHGIFQRSFEINKNIPGLGPHKKYSSRVTSAAEKACLCRMTPNWRMRKWNTELAY